MKPQITKSILLLAACALCFWMARSTQVSRNPSRGDPFSDTPGPAISQNATPVHPASSQLQPTSLPPTPANARKGARELLLDSAKQLRSVGDLCADLELQISMFGEQGEARGRYLQKGQGTPQARWDLEFQTPTVPLRMTQVFDGRFFYRLSDVDGQLALTYVDLYRVPDLPASQLDCLAGPGGWFGVGGLPTLLEQLAASFDFEPVLPDAGQPTPGKIELRVVRGRWKPEALRQLLRDELDPAWLQPSVRWDFLPRQLPHEIEITLGTDGYLRLFPYQFVFRRFETPDPEGSRSDLFSLALRQVARVESVDPAEFIVSSDNVQPVDLTSDYLARAEMYQKYPVK